MPVPGLKYGGMGAGAAGPGIVTANLELQLDARNATSAPGDGTWNDLSGNSSNFTAAPAAAAPTLSSGYFSFDGGDYFTADTGTGTFLDVIGRTDQPYTIEVWRYSTVTTDGVTMGTLNSGTAKGIYVYMPGSTKIRLAAEPTVPAPTASTTALSQNVWQQCVIAGQADGTTSTYYLNGVADGTFTGNNSGWTTGESENDMQIGRTTWGGYLPNETRISVINLYSHILTADDVLQNFNENRGWHGL